jgi:single-strand DNA-binding protein
MVTVTGNIAGEVTSRRVGADEHLLVSFRVASSERRWDKASGEWVDGDRFSASVSCWRRLAEGVLTSLVKGDPVVVSGRLSVREYEVNGERRFSTEIAAVSVGPDLARSSAKVTRRRLVVVDPAAEVRTEDASAGDPFAVPATVAPGVSSPAATAASREIERDEVFAVGETEDAEEDADDHGAAGPLRVSA